MAAFYQSMGVREADRSLNHAFVTSWLLPPILLACLRGLVAIYAFTTNFFILGWQGTHPSFGENENEFSFFTTLTFWGIAFYASFSAFHTFLYARNGRAPLDHWPRPLQALHSLFYTTVVTYPFIVTVVYWALLFNGSLFTNPYNTWTNISRHALNSVYALIEIVLPATNPPPWLHLPFLILILALYLAVAYITYATKGFYPYGFLNPANGSGRVAAYCFGILAAAIVDFAVVWSLIWLRRRLTGLGKRSRSDHSPVAGRGDLEMTGRQK